MSAKAYNRTCFIKICKKPTPNTTTYHLDYKYYEEVAAVAAALTINSMPNYTPPDISDRDSDYSSEDSDYAGDSEEDEKQTAALAST